MAENTSPPGGPDTTTELVGLVALLELRELVASELDEDSGAQEKFMRTFRPLTDGLGLESPKRKPAATSMARPPKMPVEPPKLIELEFTRSRPGIEPSIIASIPQSAPPETLRPAMRDLATVMAPPALEVPGDGIEEESAPTVAPPPMPSASVIRRIFAAIMDEIFVLSLFLLALGVTMRTLSGPGFDFSILQMHNFQNAAFFRFGILEFATIWLSYFAIGIGVVDMTFGMWVWGLRISFGNERNDSASVKKIFRIVLSFLFYAPIFPLVLLTIQRRGRNLLDVLSSTSLYRTV